MSSSSAALAAPLPAVRSLVEGRSDQRGTPSFVLRPLPEAHVGRPWPRATGPLLVVAGDATAIAGTFWAAGQPTAALTVAVAFVLVVGATGGYRLPLTASALEGSPKLVSRLVAAALAGAAVWDGSARDLLLPTLAGAAVVLATRSLTFAVLRRLRTAGRLGDRAVVLGSGPLTDELVTVLQDHPEYGVRLVGVLEPSEDGEREDHIDADTIGAVLGALDVRRMIVSYCGSTDGAMVPLLRAAVASDFQVHLVPRFFDLGVPTAGMDVVWGIPLLRLRRAALRRRAWRLRRSTEMVLASILLVLSLPLLGLLGLAVRLSSPGPILFRQPRLGEGGRTISVAKFRSLRVDGSPEIGLVIDLRTDVDLSVQAQRQREVERRLTGVGRFLRSTGLDELPQLWSVVKGDMSLVGPRPEELAFARRFSSAIPGYHERHRLPMGLTGWAQVHGLRGETSIAQRVRFDNYYIEHWSIGRDVIISLRTVGVLLRRLLRREA